MPRIKLRGKPYEGAAGSEATKQNRNAAKEKLSVFVGLTEVSFLRPIFLGYTAPVIASGLFDGRSSTTFRTKVPAA